MFLSTAGSYLSFCSLLIKYQSIYNWFGDNLPDLAMFENGLRSEPDYRLESMVLKIDLTVSRLYSGYTSQFLTNYCNVNSEGS